MAMGRREKDIKLLVAKFVKLVESLNPGERLSIKVVSGKPRPSANSKARKAGKAHRRTARKAPKARAPR